MYSFMTWILPIMQDSWFLQGLIINATFTIGSIPFTKIKIKNIFKNRKKERIKYAQDELKMLCLQKMIADRHIEKNYFENQLFIIASKYNLEVTDIYNDKKVFGKNLINTITNSDLINNDTKEELAFKIRKNKLFVNLEYNDIIDENGNILSSENEIPKHEEDIELNNCEKQNIFKLTLIVTIGIFISLLFIISTVQILYNAYGTNIILFINTIIIMIITIPIMINGIINYEKFIDKVKKYFYLLLAIMLFNIVNFICIVNILLKD